MTEPDFDDPSYDELRGLLADAAAPAALPPDVAASLDATLAELVAERAGADDDRVVPLRRRFVSQRLLVAAAAVVLLGAGGVGLSQVVGGSEQNDSTASTATAGDAGSVPAPLVPGTAEAPGAAPELAGGVPGTTSGSRGDSFSNSTGEQLNRLAETDFTTAAFDRQVSRLLTEDSERSAPRDSASEAPETAPDPGLPPTTPLSDLSSSSKADPQCPGPEVTAGGTALRITFDKTPAALVLHPVVNGSRYVAAWSCDGRQLLASTTVPG